MVDNHAHARDCWYAIGRSRRMPLSTPKVPAISGRITVQDQLHAVCRWPLRLRRWRPSRWQPPQSLCPVGRAGREEFSRLETASMLSSPGPARSRRWRPSHWQPPQSLCPGGRAGREAYRRLETASTPSTPGPVRSIATSPDSDTWFFNDRASEVIQNGHTVHW